MMAEKVNNSVSINLLEICRSDGNISALGLICVSVAAVCRTTNMILNVLDCQKYACGYVVWISIFDGGWRHFYTFRPLICARDLLPFPPIKGVVLHTHLLIWELRQQGNSPYLQPGDRNQQTQFHTAFWRRDSLLSTASNWLCVACSVLTMANTMEV